MEQFTRSNLLADKEDVELQEYLAVYGSRISQDSERLFLQDFLYPLLGKKNIKYVIPQYPFIDSEGGLRRIDFALIKDGVKIALEVNGETYHAEGIIPNDVFDDNLQRQNEILNAGWYLQRFSFSQLQDAKWRQRVKDSLHKVVGRHIPSIISEDAIRPNYLQQMALEALQFFRGKGWKKGIVVLPTGTGKTFLSAFDGKRFAGRILFIVHRLDILKQSQDAYEKVWPEAKIGTLTGEVKEFVDESKVLFASKDSLSNPDCLYSFRPDSFDYIVVDEVHHGQAPTYRNVLQYFRPKHFLLGMTATPDRMDRKDIFELFDYNKVFEFTLNEAIENGFLVPYTYYGMQDNIDYSKIRYNGRKYNVQDLDRYLIIQKRNEEILHEYIQKAKGNKAIGFCCSIKHADRMADFFNENGIPAVAITSDSEDRDEKIKGFRENKFAVVFTVDLFNEGIDFPDVRALMFLRPTESKTIFMQQLGRGLRLCSGKERVIILDFIGNYKKANCIRKFLAKSETARKNPSSGRVEKIVYEYAPKCEVHFDPQVEEILDAQDTAERDVTKEDLVDAYYALAEKLERKPSQEDINREGEFKTSKYFAIYGSWIKFLREIGEFTEASYHYPQGLDLGHVLFILKVLGSGRRSGTHLDEKYVRMRGGFEEGRIATFRRQTKYKIQGMMEMGLIVDDRNFPADQEYKLELTPDGVNLYALLKPLIQKIDLSFKDGEDGIPSWNMNLNTQDFNRMIWEYIKSDVKKRDAVQCILLKTHAVGQMLNYLYRIERKQLIAKSGIYSGFFDAPFVKIYCDQNGIEGATEEGAKHRCPFLLNILEAIGILSQSRSDVTLNEFLVCKQTMQMHSKEADVVLLDRIERVARVLLKKEPCISAEEESLLKEAFGGNFLTDKFYIMKYAFLRNGENDAK